MPDRPMLCFGPFRLEPGRGLWRGDELLPIHLKPLNVLSYLVVHAGEIVSKDALLDAVWPDVIVHEGVLKDNVNRVRKILGETARQPTYIATVHGRGYRFIAAVTAQSAASAVEATSSVSSEGEPTPEEAFTSILPQLEAPTCQALTFADFGRVTQPGQGAPPQLPAQFTSFIGREREVDQLRHLLRRVRLVTLTGPGGIGKTRLAIECAKPLLEQFPDGIFWVGLFSLNNPMLILSEIAVVLGVRETQGVPLLDTVKRFLQNRQILLILDNFEHVMAGVQLIPALLTAASELRILVTSREVLHVIGEHEFIVDLLATPSDDQLTADTLRTNHAAELFIQRAQAACPNFVLSDDTAIAIAHICQTLEGLPLALELAAARSKLFSPVLMSQRLDDCLATLSNTLIDASGREQTLRATVEWSYDLLDEKEQRLFNRLAVFAGGWAESAADAICQDMQRDDILNALSSLVDKSLVRQDQGVGGEPRFWLLHILREFAHHQLASQGATDDLALRHATYYLHFAETTAPGLHRENQEYWLAKLEEEHDNLRLALAWFLGQKRCDEALRLVAALGWFWIKRDHHSEGYRWAVQALSDKSHASPHYRAQAILQAAARLSYLTGSMGQVEDLLLESLNWGQRSGDHESVGWALGYLGLFEDSVNADRAKAIGFAQQALDRFRKTGTESVGMAWVLSALGVLFGLDGNYDQSQSVHEEAWSISRRIGDNWGAFRAVSNLGLVAYQRGDYREALAIYLRHIPLDHEIGPLHDIANWLCCIGLIMTALRRDRDAIIAFSGVDKLLHQHALHVLYPEGQLYQTSLTRLQQRCTLERFTEAWDMGQQLTYEALVNYLVEVSSSC